MTFFGLMSLQQASSFVSSNTSNSNQFILTTIVMNKQFVIKAATAIKNAAKEATKTESANLLKFSLLGPGKVCCEDVMFPIVGQAKAPSVFSL